MGSAKRRGAGLLNVLAALQTAPPCATQYKHANIPTFAVLHHSCRTQSADPSLTRTGGALSSTTAATSSGQLIGYRTTYSSTNRPLEVKREATMMMQQQQAAAASGAGDSQRPASCPAGGVERLRMAVSVGPHYQQTVSEQVSVGAEAVGQSCQPQVVLFPAHTHTILC